MIEDYLHKGLTQHVVEMKDLHCINSLLENVGKSIRDYCLVDFDFTVNDDDMLETMIVEETTNINVGLHMHCTKNLNKEQQSAYDIILNCVLNGKNVMFFIDVQEVLGKHIYTKQYLLVYNLGIWLH